MRYFAEIIPQTGMVTCLIEWELELSPQFDPAVRLAVEVTAADPLPEPGWIYDAAAGTFVPSQFVAPIPKPKSEPDAPTE